MSEGTRCKDWSYESQQNISFPSLRLSAQLMQTVEVWKHTSNEVIEVLKTLAIVAGSLTEKVNLV